MTNLQVLIDFFNYDLPNLKLLVPFGPIWFAWSWGCLVLCGALRTKRHWKTAYTRKIFHFLIFVTAAAIQLKWGTPMVCQFGISVTVLLIWTVTFGRSSALYVAIARPKDAPYQTMHIVVPYFATLIGGFSSAVFFGNFSVFGLLVTGLADAIAEPVGAKFGKHEYRVPSFVGLKVTRSFEGSTAVFVFSLVATALAISSLKTELNAMEMVYCLTLVPVASTVAESISPHGWDNLPLQVLPSGLAWSIVNGL
ncbi:MAG: hypothetical protein AAF939_07795 [Planctomycetota bacterium]